MYIPSHFKNDNIDEIKKFIQANGFGILIGAGETKIMASHIPLELYTNDAGEDVLYGHISKANAQWKNFEKNKDVLVIFSGQHTYISSSWYDHENVPTWNYIAVHVYGTIRIIEGNILLDSLKRLVSKYERNSANPVSVEKMSERVLDSGLKGIVGFEIKIKEIEAAYKLSQNRDDKNHENIIKELEKKDTPDAIAVAKEMRKRRK
jgi:transcriptional regulator